MTTKWKPGKDNIYAPNKESTKENTDGSAATLSLLIKRDKSRHVEQHSFQLAGPP